MAAAELSAQDGALARESRRRQRDPTPIVVRNELRHQSSFRAPVLGAILALAAACGGESTAPSGSTAAAIAAHFDSLFVVAIGNGLENYDRGSILTQAETSPAFGAVPATVTVHTATGSERWRLSEYKLESDSLEPLTLAMLYRDSNAHTALLLPFFGTSEISSAILIVDDSIYSGATGGSASTTLQSHGSACVIAAGLSNQEVTSLAQNGVTCNFATFQTTLSFTFPSNPNVDPALASLSASAAVTGEDFVEAAPSSLRAPRLPQVLLRLLREHARATHDRTR